MDDSGKYAVKVAPAVSATLRRLHNSNPAAYVQIVGVLCEFKKKGPRRKTDEYLGTSAEPYRSIPNCYRRRVPAECGLWHLVYQVQGKKVIKVASLKLEMT